jgi:hypothetical protein
MLVLDYIAGMLVGLLPQRYRSGYMARVGLHRAAIPSGLIQCLVFLGVLFLRYLDFMQRRMEGIGGSAIARGKEEVLAAAGVHHTIGLFVLFQYFFAPVSLVLIYFMVQGATRLVAGMATKEAVGTLSLYLVSWIHGWVECAIEDGRFGPWIADELARGGDKSFDLRIASCRPKQAWNHLMVTTSFMRS